LTYILLLSSGLLARKSPVNIPRLPSPEEIFPESTNQPDSLAWHFLLRSIERAIAKLRYNKKFRVAIVELGMVPLVKTEERPISAYGLYMKRPLPDFPQPVSRRHPSPVNAEQKSA
jgi:hypothetical protein